MAFSYIIMQCLPSTLEEFQTSSAAVSTFAGILYGNKKYVTHYGVKLKYIIYYTNRVNKQAVDKDVSVLGGVSLKAVSPSVMEAVTNFLQRNGLHYLLLQYIGYK